MKNYYLFISLFFLITGQTSAEQYAIHLDTSEEPDLSNYEVLNGYGELYIVEATEGFTTTLLGPFESKDMAAQVLNSVRGEGHYGAFITKHKNAKNQVTDTTKKIDSKHGTLKNYKDIKILSQLN